MANAPTVINGQLILKAAIAGQVSVQAQPVTNNLLFNLPNTMPSVNQVVSVLSVNGTTVTLGFTPPFPSTWGFSQITGTLTPSQFSHEGDGTKVQMTNQGATVSGDVVTYDGNGNVQDSGTSLALILAGAAPSPVTPHLGTAAAYALLGTTITNSDGAGTVISGGNINGTTITAASWTLTPPTAVSTPVSAQALSDLGTAITYFGGLTAATITTANLGTQGHDGGNAFYAGVYKSGSSINIATSIVLDGQDNPNAMFVFIATSSTITQASGTSITLINGAQAANVVWVMTGGGASWTSITPSTTVGNILAGTSITLGGGTLNGRALCTTALTLAAAGTVVTAPPAAPATAQTFTPIFAGSPAVASEFLTGYDAATGLFSADQVSYSEILGTPDLSVYDTYTRATTAEATKATLYDYAGDVPVSGNAHIASGLTELNDGIATISLSGASAFANSSYVVMLTYISPEPASPPAGQPGTLSYTIFDGTSFTINSTDLTDSTSTVAWTAIGYIQEA